MNNTALIVEALKTLATLVWAALGWVIVLTAAATALILTVIAGLRWLYSLLRPRRPPT